MKPSPSPYTLPWDTWKRDKNLYQVLFIDYSSAFNTVVQSKLVLKLREQPYLFLGVELFNKQAPDGNNLRKSSTLILNIGVPQCCCLSLLLYSLFTHNCVARHESNSIIKFTNNTTVIGLIASDNKATYSREVKDLTVWCHNNNLYLNVDKSKGIIMDLRNL